MLVQVVLARNNADTGLRQLAAVILKKFVKEKWSAASTKFEPPEASAEDKHAVCALGAIWWRACMGACHAQSKPTHSLAAGGSMTGCGLLVVRDRGRDAWGTHAWAR